MQLSDLFAEADTLYTALTRQGLSAEVQIQASLFYGTKVAVHDDSPGGLLQYIPAHNVPSPPFSTTPVPVVPAAFNGTITALDYTGYFPNVDTNFTPKKGKVSVTITAPSLGSSVLGDDYNVTLAGLIEAPHTVFFGGTEGNITVLDDPNMGDVSIVPIGFKVPLVLSLYQISAVLIHPPILLLQ